MSSYLVIARKWRPSLFEEIVGQTHVTRTLSNAVSSGRVAHAYLFSGPRGVGKTTAARILAKCLNCAEGPTPTPCNECESCKTVAAGSSVDVFEIDGASNTGVDNVRELRESVRYVPTQGKYKIYIIDEVHMLSTAAFNALLKTLEEPPPHAAFIFATTEVHKIPATILSRCQRFDFKRIPFRDIYTHLKKILTAEGVKFEDKAVYTLAREADGSLRDGQSLLEQALAFGGEELKDSDVIEALGLMDREMLFSLSEGMISGDSAACLNIVEKIYEFGYDLKRALSDLLEHIRDLTVLKVTGNSALLDLPDSELERLGKIADGVGAARLHMLFGIISRGYEDVARSATPRYSFEMALLRCAHCDETEPVAELIARLEALGKSTPGGLPQASAPPRQSAPPSRRPAPSQRDASAPQSAPAPRASEPEAEYSASPASGSKVEGGLIGFITKRNRALAPTIRNAEVREDSDSVDLIVPPAAVSFLVIKREVIEGLCEEFYKKRMKLNILSGTPDEKAPPQNSKEADPLVKDAVRILEGRVI